MPAGKTNYLIVYKNDSQVYGTANKDIALSSPPPPGNKLEDKRVVFIAYEPDNEVLSVYLLPQDEVLNAELKDRKETTKKEAK